MLGKTPRLSFKRFVVGATAGILFAAVTIPPVHAADGCTTFWYEGRHHHEGNPQGSNNECEGGSHSSDTIEEFTMGGSYDTVHGKDGSDVIHGNEGIDTAFGGGGDDVLHMGADTDYGEGGDGADTVYGAGGDRDKIIGGVGNDHVQDTVSDAAHDGLCGNGGSDTYNSVDGGTGTDQLYLGDTNPDPSTAVEADRTDRLDNTACQL